MPAFAAMSRAFPEVATQISRREARHKAMSLIIHHLTVLHKQPWRRMTTANMSRAAKLGGLLDDGSPPELRRRLAPMCAAHAMLDHTQRSKETSTATTTEDTTPVVEKRLSCVVVTLWTLMERHCQGDKKQKSRVATAALRSSFAWRELSEKLQKPRLSAHLILWIFFEYFLLCTERLR